MKATYSCNPYGVPYCSCKLTRSGNSLDGEDKIDLDALKKYAERAEKVRSLDRVVTLLL